MVLGNLHWHRKEETLRRGWPDISLWVFCSERGALTLEANVRERGFFRTLGWAGLRRVRFHDCVTARLYSSFSKGKQSSRWKTCWGHSSIKIAVDTYGHPIPGASESAVDKLDDAGYYHAVRVSATPAQLVFPSSLAHLG